jgi:hypothetical protein
LTGSDKDSQQLTFAILSGPTKGTLAGTPPNLVYTPNANFNGTDSFTFKANDGQADSAAATISIQVRALNDAPFAGNDSFISSAGAALSLTASQLLANDGDPDGESVSIVSVDTTSARGGTISFAASTIVYTPKPGFAGTDTFNYTIKDPAGANATGTVTVVVNPPSRITAVKLQSNGSATIQFTGPSSRNYRVDATIDSKNWAVLSQGTSSSSGSNSFTDNDARKFRFRVYRVVWP